MGKVKNKIKDYEEYADSLINKEYGKIVKDYSYGKYVFGGKSKNYAEKIKDKIQNCKDIDDFENEINKIALWKIDRFIVFNTPEKARDMLVELLDEYSKEGHGTLDDMIEEIAKNESNIVPTGNKVYDVLYYFLNKEETKGIRLAMLSTILRFYMPEVFPIIDVRAYRSSWVLYFNDSNNNEEFKKYYNKKTDKKLKPIPIKEEKRIKEYCRYILRCKNLKGKYGIPENASMKDMDIYLYEIDNAGEWGIDSNLIS